MTAMFVNLPVTDLERAKAFYEAVGFSINPQFTDHNAACVVVEDGHSYSIAHSGRSRGHHSRRPASHPRWAITS